MQFFYNDKNHMIAELKELKKNIVLVSKEGNKKVFFNYKSLNEAIRKDGWVCLSNKINRKAQHKIAVSLISFSNNRVRQKDKLYFIGQKENTLFFISSNELSSVEKNYYPELLRFSKDEVQFLKDKTDKLYPFRHLLTQLLMKERVFIDEDNHGK